MISAANGGAAQHGGGSPVEPNTSAPASVISAASGGGAAVVSGGADPAPPVADGLGGGAAAESGEVGGRVGDSSAGLLLGVEMSRIESEFDPRSRAAVWHL